MILRALRADGPRAHFETESPTRPTRSASVEGAFLLPPKLRQTRVPVQAREPPGRQKMSTSDQNQPHGDDEGRATGTAAASQADASTERGARHGRRRRGRTEQRGQTQ